MGTGATLKEEASVLDGLASKGDTASQKQTLCGCEPAGKSRPLKFYLFCVAVAGVEWGFWESER